MFKIYGLVCPKVGEIRYIGKTKNKLGDRLRGHLSDARAKKYRHHTCRWLGSLLSDGLKPEIVLLEETDGDWSALEVQWIAKAKELGWPLTNSTIGGDGAPEPSEEAIARKREKMERAWENPDFIAKMKKARNDPEFLSEQAERLKSRWAENRDKLIAARWTPEARAKQAANLEARRAKMLVAMTPEVRAKQGEKLKAWWAERNKHL